MWVSMELKVIHMSEKPIIPKEWFDFDDWLKERAERVKGYDDIRSHYEFVRHEWVSHIANTIRQSESIRKK